MPRDTMIYESVRGGISVGPGKSNSHGTVGLVVADAGDDSAPLLLTSAHVVSHNYQVVNDDLYVPFKTFAKSRKVASFEYLKKGTRFPWLEGGGGPPVEDYIAIQLDPDVEHDYGWIRDIGMVNGYASVKKGDAVKMRGSETGQTSYGVVEEESYDSKSGLFKDCIVVRSKDSDQFSQSGDSGSMVVTMSNQCVGILQGYHKEAMGSLVYPIERVLKKCNVKILSRPGLAMGVKKKKD